MPLFISHRIALVLMCSMGMCSDVQRISGRLLMRFQENATALGSRIRCTTWSSTPGSFDRMSPCVASPLESTMTWSRDTSSIFSYRASRRRPYTRRAASWYAGLRDWRSQGAYLASSSAPRRLIAVVASTSPGFMPNATRETSFQKSHSANGLPQPHSWFSPNARSQMKRNSPTEQKPSCIPITRSRRVLPLRPAHAINSTGIRRADRLCGDSLTLRDNVMSTGAIPSERSSHRLGCANHSLPHQ